MREVEIALAWGKGKSEAAVKPTAAPRLSAGDRMTKNLKKKENALVKMMEMEVGGG